LSFDRGWANTLTKYGAFGLIGGASSAFYLNIDKILINRYMTLADVGIYKAYYFAFINNVIMFVGIFITVFFPTASKYKDKRTIFKRINRIIPYIITIGFPVLMVLGIIILKLYGPQYPLDVRLVILFSIAGICISIDSTYAWLMSAVGIKGIKIVSVAAVIVAVVNILLNLWLIPLIGIEGGAIAIIISYLFSIGIILSKRKYYFLRADDAGN
jgi:O-antigen/teichoic acid export membrane protein